MNRTTIAILLSAGMANVQGQWQTIGNAGLNPTTNFLGTTDNKPMNIRTEDIRRFRLNFDESYTIGSFTSQAKNGSLLLSPDVDQFYTNGAPGPFSLIHVAAADDNAQEGSYRNWMGTGISLTGNDDHAYWGLKPAALDNTDVVLHWSDNPGKWLKDRMRFIFTIDYDESTTGAGSLEGLEGMRLWPKNDDEVNVGLGDFYARNQA